MANPYTTLEAINSFVVGLKTDGVWSKITEAYLMAGVTFGGITVKLKGTGTLTNNNFVSGDYQATGAGAGLSGDGSTKYLNTGLPVSSGNNKSLSYYATLAQTDNISVGIISADNGSLTDGLSLGRVNGGTLDEFNSGSTSTFRVTVAQASSNGCFIGSARTLTDRELYRNGSTIGSSSAAMADMTTPRTLQVFANGGALISDATLTFAHIGTGLTDTDASNLTNRVETLMDALGCGVIS